MQSRHGASFWHDSSSGTQRSPPKQSATVRQIKPSLTPPTQPGRSPHRVSSTHVPVGVGTGVDVLVDAVVLTMVLVDAVVLVVVDVSVLVIIVLVVNVVVELVVGQYDAIEH